MWGCVVDPQVKLKYAPSAVCAVGLRDTEQRFAELGPPRPLLRFVRGDSAARFEPRRCFCLRAAVFNARAAHLQVHRRPDLDAPRVY
jgi:hypothetical protein